MAALLAVLSVLLYYIATAPYAARIVLSIGILGFLPLLIALVLGSGSGYLGEYQKDLGGKVGQPVNPFHPAYIFFAACLASSLAIIIS